MSNAEIPGLHIDLRPAGKADLAAINQVIERAVNTWNLPERVRRLALPTYLYHAHDLQHLHAEVADDRMAGMVGVAAWEAAAERDCPEGKSGLLLHGLYVDPAHQHLGVGGRLLLAAADAAHKAGYDGLLVKAQSDACSFFSSHGLRMLAVIDASRDYPNRYWRDVR
jgi:predicted N-acetyltransferase YhbS